MTTGTLLLFQISEFGGRQITLLGFSHLRNPAESAVTSYLRLLGLALRAGPKRQGLQNSSHWNELRGISRTWTSCHLHLQMTFHR